MSTKVPLKCLQAFCITTLMVLFSFWLTQNIVISQLAMTQIIGLVGSAIIPALAFTSVVLCSLQGWTNPRFVPGNYERMSNGFLFRAVAGLVPFIAVVAIFLSFLVEESPLHGATVSTAAAVLLVQSIAIHALTVRRKVSAGAYAFVNGTLVGPKTEFVHIALLGHTIVQVPNETRVSATIRMEKGDCVTWLSVDGVAKRTTVELRQLPFLVREPIVSAIEEQLRIQLRGIANQRRVDSVKRNDELTIVVFDRITYLVAIKKVAIKKEIG